MHFLGISGSLRRQSLNTAALRACTGLLPPGVTMDLADISAIPLYNEEIREQGLPASVLSLREQILKADALVIATPEYNYSMPGVLKNAIDWASRPPSQPFEGKPIALMSASPGGFWGCSCPVSVAASVHLSQWTDSQSARGHDLCSAHQI